MCPLYPKISWDPAHYSQVPGLCVHFVLGYPRTSWDVSHSDHYPRSQAYASFMSQDILGHQPSCTLQQSPRLMCLLCPMIS